LTDLCPAVPQGDDAVEDWFARLTFLAVQAEVALPLELEAVGQGCVGKERLNFV